MNGFTNRQIDTGFDHSAKKWTAVAMLLVGILWCLLAPPVASAASWEAVKHFAPLNIPEPNPPAWPEDVQLGGVAGMAVNTTGAGGVKPGTVYAVGGESLEPWHVARFSQEGEFELGWKFGGRCGPKAEPPTVCNSFPTGASGGIDIAIDQATGNVYVFSIRRAKTIFEYRADGTGPIAEFGELDLPGTVTTSPGKVHGSNFSENIAVDNSGNVYVYDAAEQSNHFERLMKYEPCTPGNFESYCYAGQGHDIGGVFPPGNPPARPMVDSAGDVYVSGEDFIAKYDPAQPATAICTFSYSAGGITATAVNPVTGAVFFFASKPKPEIHQLAPCNAESRFVESGPSFAATPQRGQIEAMAFNPQAQFPEIGEPKHEPGILYAGAPQNCPKVGSCPIEAQGQSSLGYMFAPAIRREPLVVSESVSVVRTTNATLNARVNPNGSQTTYEFQYLSEKTFAENTHHPKLTIRATGGTLKLSFGGETTGALPFDANASEVEAALDEISTIGPGNAIVSGGPGDEAGSSPYKIDFEPAVGGLLPLVSADGSGLTGTAHAAEVNGFFAGAGEAPVGGSLLGTGQQPLLASVNIGGLAPATSYRYRVVATNSDGTAAGVAERFETFPPEAEGLPDGRAYELVSPFQKNGGEVLPLEPIRASCGNECKPGQATGRYPVQVAASGDALAYQGQPFSLNEGPAEYDEYVSTRTSAGWETAGLSPPLAGVPPAGSHFEAFAFDPTLTGSLTYATNQALVPGAPAEYRNIFGEPAGNRFDLTPLLTAYPPNRSAESFVVRYVGASADLSRVFFEANDALTGESESAPPAVDGGAGKFNLYEWRAGQLKLVNIQPLNNETIPGASFGSGYQLANPAEKTRDTSNAIAANGSMAFWSSENGQVYVREDGEHTREIPDHTGKFLSASTDGSKVLLSDGVLYDLQTGVSTDLTQGSGGFQGIVGQSEDLSSIYVVATTVLTGTPNDQGATAQAGQDNLYAWHEGDLSFVGTLLAEDLAKFNLWRAAPVQRAAEASPNGRWLAFNSKANLTRANTVGPCSTFDLVLKKWVGSVPCEEVYLYDSQSGVLRCVSCNPTGTTPTGGSFLSVMHNANLLFESLQQPNFLTDTGRLYFDSRDQLSSNDTNGQVEDVYQYEPAGIGKCAKGEGCVSLISTGRGSSDSDFLAADSSGENVFFTTRLRLVPRDQDELIDAYDARVEGGIAADYEMPAPECQGEGCQPAQPVVPNEAGPASSTVEGNGNVKPEKKHKHKKHKKHKKKHHHQSKKKKPAKNAKSGRGSAK